MIRPRGSLVSQLKYAPALALLPQDKLKVTWDTSDWQEVYPRSIPQQQNGYDCGVFALMFCNRMGTKGGAFDFRQADIQFNIRAAIVCDLLDGKIQATAWRG